MSKPRRRPPDPLKPGRRSRTVTQVAAKLGITPRAVRYLVAVPREDYEAAARERRQKAAELRAQGKAWADVGLELGVSATAARLLAARYDQVPANGPFEVEAFK